ncbi:TLC domain-containing protein 4-B-like [Babylonia areolata]|uniref:TLC domain-containing protein 4-B-like n=1 Tax=Babylonia areolata TaxID=304850 RepID=UPI003FD59A02
MGRPLKAVAFDATYYPAAAVSCVFFLYLYKFVSPTLSAKMSQKYCLLSEEKKIDWNTRVLSTVHATVVSSMCAYSLIYDSEISEDPIWWDAPAVRTSCAIVVGYMASDLVIMTIHYKHIGEVFYFFHHGASMYAYYYVMTYGVLPYFANYRLVAEFSTPFVNQRWFLNVLGYSKSSPLFVANGIAMAVTFFAVRIAVMPPYWLKVYSVYGTEPFNRLGHIQLVLVITCAVLDIINLYWFYKIYTGCRRVVEMFFLRRNREDGGGCLNNKGHAGVKVN